MGASIRVTVPPFVNAESLRGPDRPVISGAMMKMMVDHINDPNSAYHRLSEQGQEDLMTASHLIARLAIALGVSAEEAVDAGEAVFSILDIQESEHGE